jgi:hypothetical protein
MSLIERQFSAFFSSAVSSGSTRVGTLGNRFTVQLNTPLTVPRDSLYASLEVVSAKVWNSSPNISPDIGNNHIHFSYGGSDYDIENPEGLYGIEELNASMSIFFVQNGLPSSDIPDTLDLFEITEDGATQKVSIKFNFAGVTIDFTKPNSCIDVLGFYTEHNIALDTFTSSEIISSTTLGESVRAPNEARFNRVVNYYIQSNLLSDGIPINSKSSGIITEVPVNVKVGSLINYTPNNPLRVDCSDLIGQSKQLISFALVDQLGRDVSTSGEEWSLAIVIRYHIRENSSNQRRPNQSCPEDTGYYRSY